MFKVILLWNEMQDKHLNWRSGQALYNAIYELYPDIVSNHIYESSTDPYYDDRYISRCLIQLSNFIEWGDKSE